MKIKKLILVVSMLAVMMSLAGCGGEAELGFDYDKTELTLQTMQYFTDYVAIDEEYYDYFLEDGTAFEKSAIQGIDQAQSTDKVGKFESYTGYISSAQSTGSFNPESVKAKFTEGEGTVTVTIINKAENRDVEVSVQYSENPEYFKTYASMAAYYSDAFLETDIYQSTGYDAATFMMLNGYDSLDDVRDEIIAYSLANSNIPKYVANEMVVSAVYSNGELVGQAGMNTLIGMGTVFIVLIFISFIISLFKYLPALLAKKAKVPEAKKEEAPAAVAAPAVVAKDENLVNDAELVAVITAAIYAAQGVGGCITDSKDKLVVRSIRRVNR